MCLCANAQSVLGIRFGLSYSVVKRSLEDRFGEFSVHENKGVLKIYDVEVGGFHFKYAEFDFQRNSGLSYFNYASFQTFYSATDIQTARDERDYLYSLLKDKYKNDYVEEYINKQGYKCYRFGTDPVDKNKALGRITLEKSKGKDGKTRLYLLLTYGPIYYLDKSSDF